MVYDKVINGRFVDLRSITIDDAEFSFMIRADKKNRDLVGQPAASLDEQLEFIKWQMNEPNDYYFVVLNKKGERIGLTGVYDIKDDMGEVGREVSYGTPAETMETSLLLNGFCKNILHLKKICYVIYLNNKKQMHIQKRNGIEPLKIIKRSGIESAYYESEIGINDDYIQSLLDIIGDDQVE
ncbi:MAG: GNAT family N-acetyltransferase [Lachnospiraceae bacterium]|nr:GNAT family N-acetyltransferase [Lachnospiraceae bacterium]